MPFVCLSIGGVRSFVAGAQSVWWRFEFFGGFLRRFAVFLKFLRSFLNLLRSVADSFAVDVLFVVLLWFAEVNEKDEKQSFQSRGSRRS